ALFALTREVDLKIFLYSDFDSRLRHIAEKRRAEDLKQIEEDIKASDMDRSSLVERLYHKNWRDPLLYDIMINTSKVPYEEVASFITEALKLKR
ncbi:MAG: cytidylate kinase family protein, partial [Thermoproteota archaeon]